MSTLQRHWQRRTAVSLALAPLGSLYCLLTQGRRWFYRCGIKRIERPPAAVIIVGNITVGGTGKTPLVLWLTQWLREQRYSPGIISRGYGGEGADWPVVVQADSDPAAVGDEPVLLARNCACPVIVARKRAAAATRLVNEYGCNVIVSDDGLQHYQLARDFEIAVIDGERRFGNGLCLPAGPLREPRARLRQVHACVTNGLPHAGELGMQLAAVCFRRVADPGITRPLDAFAGKRVHAIAGIGNPKRFFAQLRALDLEVIEHPFPDHFRFRSQDIRFDGETPIIMTEKDAVKCERFVDGRYWYLTVEADPDPALGDLVLKFLRAQGGRPHGGPSSGRR